MDLQIARSHSEFYKERLLNKRLQLERSNILNKEHERVQQKLVAVQELESEMRHHHDSLDNIKTVATRESDNFTKRRINYLNDRITDVLATIFPEEQFEADINYDFKYGGSKAFLRLKDRNGEMRVPSISEGKLCQYLISFASAASTVASLGSNVIYIDEAFGVSSGENLPKIGEIINSYSENGLKFFIVSQNPHLYRGIPRREIRFHKDNTGKYGKVVVDSIIDY